MSSRSLTAGGAPPAYSITNPTSADDGKVLSYSAAARSCTWTPAPVAAVRGTGQLVFSAATGTGEFDPAAFEVIVQTFPLGGKLVTFAFAGASTMAVGKTFAGAGNTILAPVDASLTPSAGTLIVGSASSSDGATLFTTKVYITAGTIGMINVGGANYANGAGTVGGFSVSYMLPTSFEYLDQELQDAAAEDLFELLPSEEQLFELPPPEEQFELPPADVDVSGEVSDTASDFSFAGLE